MAKVNGKSEAAKLDLEHELPAGESGEETGAAAAVPAATGAISEVEKLKAEREALLDRLARLQAEFDNARKRAVREQQEFREYAAADVIKGLLPALDSFERALKASQNPPKQNLGGAHGSGRAPASTVGPEAGEFRSGIELIYRQFQDALQKAGVQAIVSVGQPFDPRIHEAIEMVDTTEVPDHHVMDELQRGYKFKDRLLRPAMVRVARNAGG
ncbi:MAG: nucleotide exchange factor GrpE [Terriglobales bacterium]